MVAVATRSRLAASTTPTSCSPFNSAESSFSATGLSIPGCGESSAVSTPDLLPEQARGSGVLRTGDGGAGGAFAATLGAPVSGFGASRTPGATLALRTHPRAPGAAPQ